MSSTITVTRQRRFWGKARLFKIFIDGNHAGDVRDGKSVRLSVDPGRHEIQLKVDWSTSPMLILDVGEDEDVRLICGINESAGVLAWFSGKDCLSLVQEPGHASAESRGLARPAPPLERERAPAKPAGGDILISYRRSDSPDVSGRIYDRLVQAFGKEHVFKDVDSIPLGVDFRHHLEKSISECHAFLAVVGNSWVDVKEANGSRRLDNPADHVRIEIEWALKRDIPIIPLLVRGASMPKPEELPASIQDFAYRNGITIRPDPDFHRDMDRLSDALNKTFTALSR